MVTDLKLMTVAELLKLHSMVGDELRQRGVVRSSNNPTGDYAEYLFCTAFAWTQAPNSQKGYDATAPDRTKYQIKGRRVHQNNLSRQLSALRDLNLGQFDMLAGVIFDADYRVLRAALVPHAVVLARSKFKRSANTHTFFLLDDVWDEPGVQDVTAKLAEVTP